MRLGTHPAMTASLERKRARERRREREDGSEGDEQRKHVNLKAWALPKCMCFNHLRISMCLSKLNQRPTFTGCIVLFHYALDGREMESRFTLARKGVGENVILVLYWGLNRELRQCCWVCASLRRFIFFSTDDRLSKYCILFYCIYVFNKQQF